MAKLAANLSMLFTELPFLDRFGAAANAGFRAVEFMFPYEERAELIATRTRDLGLEVVLFTIGCEYRPVADTWSGLHWASRYLGSTKRDMS